MTKNNMLHGAQAEYKDYGVQNTVNPVPIETASIVVFPNPATDKVMIHFNYKLPGKYSFRLYDMNGQRVLDKKSTSNLEKVSIQSLSLGLYIIKVIYENDEVIGYEKLMKP